MKGITITHSKKLQNFLNENPPTAGMMSAFQFGANLWLGICGGAYDKGNWRLKALVDLLKPAKRITLNYFLEKTLAPEGFIVCLEIVPICTSQDKPIPMMRSYFHIITGEIITY